MSDVLTMPCSDCGYDTTVRPDTLARGNSVREPGEALCPSCTSHRTRLVGVVRSLPGDIRSIRAQRMRGFAS